MSITVGSSKIHVLLAVLLFLTAAVESFSMLTRSYRGVISCGKSSLFKSYWGRRRKTMISAASSSSSSTEEDALISKQKSVSSGSKTSSSDKRSFKTEVSFLRHQEQVFDKMAQTFASGELVSEELAPIYRHLAARILGAVAISEKQQDDDGAIQILDVACGAGVLWPFLAQQAQSKLEVTGVDLSSNMVEAAAVTADNLFEEYMLTPSTKHSFVVVQSDVIEYNSNTAYDLVIANACFGNFWNQTAVLEHLATQVKLHGCVAVTHPLGAGFVERLHNEDPSTVPHLLPVTLNEWNDVLLTLPLQVTELVLDTTIGGTDHSVPFYFTALQKVRARALPQVLRLRGKVDIGYGRGGKKLGFPTANLPSRLFQDALEYVLAGVYFGWAVLEGGDDDAARKGRNVPYKAVVNVGFSPTFEGNENPEKIVEAHLMFDDSDDATPLDPPDFYGETMRLQLIGFLRPEIKFPSFPDLIAQIKQDVVDAKAALDRSPFATFQTDTFLTVNKVTSWKGKSGGSDEASWEFQNVRAALDEFSE